MHKSHRVKSLLPGRKYVLIGLMPLMLSGCASQSGNNWFDNWGKCALGGGIVGAAGGATSSGSAAAVGGGIGLLLGGTICALTSGQPEPEPEPVVIEEHVEVQPEPAPVVVDTKLPPERLDNLYFMFDSTKVEPASEEVLENAAQTLSEFPHINLKVTGYTDSTGPATYNDKLSVRRAESVKSYLVKQKGVDINRIKTSGLGELKVNNTTREGRAHNRRVELELYAASTPVMKTPAPAPKPMEMEKPHQDAMPPSPPQPGMQSPGQ